MVELLSGFPLFIQQFKALLTKNLILTWRSKCSVVLQLFTPLICLLLIFVIEKLDTMDHQILFGNVIDPPTIVAPGIPACEEKFLLRQPCYDFIWSGNDNPRIEEIAGGIMRNNPGRPISQDRVKSFRTPEEVDEWLYRNPMRCPGALHFVERNTTVISYGIQTNYSLVPKEFQDDSTIMQVTLHVAAEREIARSLLGDPNFSWTVGHKSFAYPLDLEKRGSLINFFGAIPFLGIAMFGFVFLLGSLVAERELKLRQAMSMMGLYESAYWMSWLTWQAMLALAISLITVLSGMMFQFNYFLHNSFAILFLVFFLFQISMVGFAFIMSTFIRKSSSATSVGFSIFIASTVLQMFPLIDLITKKRYRMMLSLFPPIPFAHAFGLLSRATATPEDQGISWSKRGECEGCSMTIEGVLRALISAFCFWFILAIYMDNVIPDSNGMRRPFHYFLMPSYWTGEGDISVEDSDVSSLENDTPDDEDVLAEETIVKSQVSEGKIDPDIAVQIRGLAKTFPGTVGVGFFKLRKTAPYHAVKGLWVNLPKNQLFCLLGPNGAGKTTAISCLTGLMPATGGDALIYGQSIQNSVGMSNIRKIIGVCPQFDILWDALSGREHLRLFSFIKGLPPSTIEEAVEKSLAEVKLGTAAEVRASSYSGGMKRRLSVAIALIGDPKLVFLDEPTTGMDPITRRRVWDIIEGMKKGRAIILTTHSMEEADILSDRIAIMAKGRLRCIGTSIRLKSRFGSGYVAIVSLAGDSDTLVKEFFKNRLGVEPVEENHKFLTFIVPQEKEELLTDFFAELQGKEAELGISDVQIGLSALEDVFMSIAKMAETESSCS